MYPKDKGISCTKPTGIPLYGVLCSWLRLFYDRFETFIRYILLGIIFLVSTTLPTSFSFSVLFFIFVVQGLSYGRNPAWAEILASVSWVCRHPPLRSLPYLSVLVYHWRSWIFWSFYILPTLLQDVEMSSSSLVSFATLCTYLPVCFIASRTHLLVGLFSSRRKDPPEGKTLDLFSICLCFFGTKGSVHTAIS